MSIWSRRKAGKAEAKDTAKGVGPAAVPGQPYAMARIGDNAAEIVLYGDVVRERPMDWWTGEPEEGPYIVLSEFLEDLKQVENVAELTVRIHSVGGNVYEALTIHNRLKACKAQVTVVIDGVALSAGAMIAAAGDRVQVYPGSLMMIHKCWGDVIGNADELRRTADGFDAADRSQAAIYQAKTGMDTEALLAMMAAETYMTGQEAIDKGFADEMAEGAALEVAASADRRTLYVGGRPVWASARKDGIPAVIPTALTGAEAPAATHKAPLAQTGGQNGGVTMANTLEELMQENPTLAQALMDQAKAKAAKENQAAGAAAQDKGPAEAKAGAEEAKAQAAEAERQRIMEIDALAGLFDAETIHAAKYGEHPCTAKEMTYKAAQDAAKAGGKFLAALERDTKASGAQDVGGAASGGEPGTDTGGAMTPQQMMAQGRADAKALNKTDKEEK